MKGIHKIFILLISMVMLASPAMAFSAENLFSTKKEMSCCAEKMNDKTDKHKADSNKCNDGNHCKDECPKRDCCLILNVLKTFAENINQEPQILLFPGEQLKNEYYSLVYIKDISYSFWHPPKYIS